MEIVNLQNCGGPAESCRARQVRQLMLKYLAVLFAGRAPWARSRAY